MAFNWFSVPAYIVIALAVLAGTFFLSQGASVKRRAWLLINVPIVAVLCWCAWFVNQGEWNYYGELLYLVALAVLLVIGAVSLGVAWFIGRAKPKLR